MKGKKNLLGKQWLALMMALFLFLSIGINKFTVAESTMVEPDMQELKLLLNADTFTDRLEGYAYVWGVVKALASEQGVETIEEEDPFKEGARRILYLDTAEGELAKANLILRLRYKMVDDEPEDKADLTVKYRSPFTETVDSEAVKAAEGVESTYKIETDVSGFGDGIVGNNKPAASISCTVKGVPNEDISGDTLGVFAKYVATLGELGIPLESELEMVAGSAVREFKAVPGELDFGDGLVTEVEMSVWYVYDTGQLVIGEVSYELDPDEDTPEAAIERAYEYFNALQDKLSDIAYQPSATSHKAGSGGMGLKTQVLRDIVAADEEADD